MVQSYFASSGEMWPSKFALPFVGGIIERNGEHGREVLVQTRHNPKRDPRYTGTIEFPGGILDRKFESVFDALSREIFEETGLTLKQIVKGSQHGAITSTNKNDKQQGFSPFYCLQQLEGDYPWVGFVFVCEVDEGELRAQDGETKNPCWFEYNTLKQMFIEDQNQFFGLQVPAWKKYFSKQI